MAGASRTRAWAAAAVAVVGVGAALAIWGGPDGPEPAAAADACNDNFSSTPANLQWSNPSNWSSGLPGTNPGVNDVPCIPTNVGTIVFDGTGYTGSANIKSLPTAASALSLTGGTLHINGTAAGEVSNLTGGLTLTGATFTIDNPGANTVGNLNLAAGGFFGGAGSVTTNSGSTFAWSDGQLTGGGGTLTVPAGASITTSSAFLVMNGYGLHAVPSFTMNAALTIFGATLATDGTVTMADASRVYDNAVSGSSWTANGTVSKTSGPGTATIAIPFTGPGGLSVSSGTLSANPRGGAVAGPVSVGIGSKVSLLTGSYTSATALTGPGTLDLEGNLTIASPVTVATVTEMAGEATVSGLFTPSGLTTINGGTLTLLNAGANVFQGLNLISGNLGGNAASSLASGTTFTWSGGSLSNGSGGTGTLTVPAGASIITGTATEFFNGFALHIVPNVTFNSTRLYPQFSTLVTDGSVTMVDGSDVDDNGVGGSSWTANGAVSKPSGTGTATIILPFTGAGGLSDGAGTMDVNPRGATVSGPVSVASGATLNLRSGTFNSSTPLSGPGTVNLIGNLAIASPVTVATVTEMAGEATVSGLFTPSGLTTINGGTLTLLNAGANVFQGLNLISGNLGGNAASSLASGTTFTWSGGSLSNGSGGTGTLTVPGGASIITGTATEFFNGFTLHIVPNVTFNSTRLYPQFSTLVTDGSVTMVDGSDVDDNVVSGSSWTANGTVSKPTGTGTATISLPFTANAGVTVGAGRLNVYNNPRVAGGSVSNGATLATSGDLTIPSGTLTLSGGTAALQLNSGTARLTGGGLAGVGTVTGNVDNSAGTTTAGSPLGTLSLTGTYSQGATATLSAAYGGTTPPAQCSLLSVGGTATVAGTLVINDVNGSSPSANQSCSILHSTGARTGTFSTVTPLGYPAGQQPSLSYGANDVFVGGGTSPTVTSMSPTMSSISGTQVTITGSGLAGASVTFGANPGTNVMVNSSGTSLTVVSPAANAGTVAVTVATAVGSAPAGNYTYVAGPIASSMTPTSGPAGGGTTVTINGSNLQNATVTFGPNSASSVVVNSAGTSLTAVAPAGTGTVPVSVNTVGGTASPGAFFTYVPAPTTTSASPSSGPEAGGTVVTITGSNLQGASVSFGANPGNSIVVNGSGTSLTVSSPAGTGGVLVRVTTPGGTANAGSFTYVPAPTTTGMTPTSGPAAGGTSVAITGTNLTGASVSFGPTPGTGVVVNAAGTSLTVVSPAGSAGGAVVVTVTTPGGSASPGSYTYVAPAPGGGGGGGGAPSAVSPPPPPPGSTNPRSASSASSTGTPTATSDPTTVTGSGPGAFTVAQYPSDPSVPFPALVADSQFFSVGTGAGSAFSALTIVEHNVTAGRDLWWSNGTTWAKVEPQSFDPPTGTITAVITTSSTPTLAQMVGSAVFATGVTPAARVAGTDRFATAIAASTARFPTAGSAKTAVLARGDDFADALAGGPLASTASGPLLLTTTAALPDAVFAEIQRAVTPSGTVYVLGGTNAVSDAVAARLSGAGFTVKRLSGANRFATAVAIANQLGNPATVLIATGTNFADGVTAGAASAVAHGAVLLSDGATQATETSAYLAGHPGGKTYAIGSPAASAYPTATAIVGADRYDTAVAAAKAFYGAAPTAVVAATGTAFPDALISAGFAAASIPVILVPATGSLPASVSSYLGATAPSVLQITVVGGTAAIGSDVVTAMQYAAG